MGERQSDGGRSGRRRVHPEGRVPAQDRPASVPGGRPVVGTADLQTLLAAALIREGVDAGAEQRAVAAFVAARESGAHGMRTRRRDDWRARRRRFGSRSLKATLSALVAGLTLSGVAVAGIGVEGSSTDGPAEHAKGTQAPSGTTPAATPKSADPGTGSDGRDANRPDTAKDTEAHCRSYEKLKGRGTALDATAWKRLTEAAGGASHVDAYCAEQAEQNGPRPGNTGRPEKSTAGPDSSGNGAPGNESNAPNSGTASGSTGNESNGNNGNKGNGPDTGAGGTAGKPAEPSAGNP
ncbi:hypothetical protein ACIQCD_22640 [Streptomyces sp. NPDC093250]|uniref:hypothetical protein n=1 Tax=Streptomyces sp. NPDC093250 TaxID=3366036 RepID=UPI0037F4850C